MPRIFRPGLLSIYAAALIFPLIIFIDGRGGLQFIQALRFTNAARLLFPLIGLWAFTALTLQLILGSNWRRLRQQWPNVLTFHRYHGLVAFCLAWIHPLFMLWAFGATQLLHLSFVSHSLQRYAYWGVFGFVVINVTVVTAFAHWRWKTGAAFWRLIHLGNYIGWAALWFHSWSIGSDVRTTALRYLWLLYGLIGVMVIGDKIYRIIKNRNTNAATL